MSKSTPSASSIEARERMERQGKKDTKPEIAVRRACHRLGLRYRVDTAPLRGMRSRADMVFPRERIAVFVDGCFWHGCPKHGTWPKKNAEWWRQKIESNIERDSRVDSELEAAGWSVIRIWEHEEPAAAAERIQHIVNAVRGRNARGSTERDEGAEAT